jgi:hypothetical protein
LIWNVRHSRGDVEKIFLAAQVVSMSLNTFEEMIERPTQMLSGGGFGYLSGWSEGEIFKLTRKENQDEDGQT